MSEIQLSTENVDSSDTPQNNKPDEKPYYTRPFVIIGAVAFVCLWAFLCFSVGGLSLVSLQLFVTGFLAFLTLIVIAAQAEIYQRQERRMIEQRDTMRDQLAEMKGQREITTHQIAQSNSQLILARDQTIQSIRQGEIMRDTLQHTKAAFEMVERPIVLVTNASVTPELTENRPLRLAVTIQNKGRTAAQNIRVFFKCNYPSFYGGTFYPHPMDWNTAHEMELLPSGDVSGWIAAPADEFTVSFEDHSQIAHGRKMFVIHGMGRYEDLSGKRYLISPFAYRFDPSQGFVPFSSFIIHHADNWPGDMDDDEERIEELIAERDGLRARNAAKSETPQTAEDDKASDEENPN